ncbi:MAG: ABC transporter ATP-binding protein [Chloroflexota bacterium]
MNKPSAPALNHPSTQSTALQILWRGFSYLRPHWVYTAGAYVALILASVVALTMPQFIRWIIDQGIAEQNSQLLTWSILALLGLSIARGLFVFLQGRWSEIASQNVAYDLRNAMLDQLTHLSFAYHNQAESGQLLARSMQDVERLRFLTGRATLGVFNGLLLMVGTTIVLFTMNPILALLSMITMPLLAYQAFRFGQLYRPLSLAIQQQLAVLTTLIEQNLRGARIVKAFAQEDAEIHRYNQENTAWFKLAAQAARLQAINVPLLDLIANLAMVMIVWYGGRQVISGSLTLGELVAFSTYLAQLGPPVRRLGLIIPALAQAVASGERVFDVLDEVSDVKETTSAEQLPPIDGRVRFENVSFGYREEHPVLQNVSFEIQPGQVLALLGATGSGKSSIINLLPRFYEPMSGQITIDNHDIQRQTIHSLRKQIGIVLQETILFATSVRENIGYGRPDATENEIIEAAKAAQAHDFIMKMPNGYDTEVGERGATLSGGQRQRVAIARALLKDPRILILDDATASVDTETERLIQKALQQLMKGRTSIVIAQRLSTIRQADLILVMERGRVLAAGNHHKLYECNDLYRQIYAHQSSEERFDN